MKYCYNTTLNHPISIIDSKILQDFNNLIIKEGYLGEIPLFENSEIVINLDLAEEIIAKNELRNPSKSMDLAFGLANNDSSISKVIMAELRLNYDNPNNLNRNELIEKVKGSITILSKSIPITKLYIFIFKTNIVHQAVHRMFRMFPKIDSNYVAMDISELKNRYF